MKKKSICTVIIGIFLTSALTGCIDNTEKERKDLDDYQTIIDMAGREVWIPRNISRVIDISDGFTTSIMYHLGVQDKLVGLGSRNLHYIDRYDYTTTSGENYSYENGMNPVTYLYPPLKDLPAVGQYGVAINYETVASLNPDIVIVRVGYCSLNTDEYGEEQDITRAIDTLESLDIPIVILYGPPALTNPTMDNVSTEIQIIGQIFNQRNQSRILAEYLESIVEMIKSRTITITKEEKPRVLLFGLSPNARETGGAGDVLCLDTMESYFIEEIVNAKNAYQDTGGWKILSTEQILALNPDVIILPTDWGYHPPRELYEAPYYKNLQELDAIKNQRVWALPYTPYNCAKRVEYPIELMVIAKASYPDLFEDIIFHEWVLDFYQKVYHVDGETAKDLRSIQWLDWTIEEDT